MHSPRSFLFVLGSSRRDGNSEALARHAAAALPVSVTQRWIRLRDVPLPPFEDVRHTGTGLYEEPDGNVGMLRQATREATDLVIVSPLYWYSLSADAKLYLDHWSGWLRVPGPRFTEEMREKTLWGVTAYASADVALADPLVGTLRNTAGFFRMGWGGVLLANGTRPGQILEDGAALDRAARFFDAGTGGIAGGDVAPCPARAGGERGGVAGSGEQPASATTAP
ncbi:NAD(P)H-dependent oxidoreductase [Streptomyces sp. NBC_01218]|uniref:NAD(P)H-dependent oxidoreductase n=1 Tax=Streptomyces sp. NBC_01218 TaxID=2903780 RepID=UPI002E16675D|nr:NAD(P)H-dependent oxidoreductase [Streptomyces sp. NBC_01218]